MGDGLKRFLGGVSLSMADLLPAAQALDLAHEYPMVWMGVREWEQKLLHVPVLEYPSQWDLVKPLHGPPGRSRSVPALQVTVHKQGSRLSSLFE